MLGRGVGGQGVAEGGAMRAERWPGALPQALQSFHFSEIAQRTKRRKRFVPIEATKEAQAMVSTRAKTRAATARSEQKAKNFREARIQKKRALERRKAELETRRIEAQNETIEASLNSMKEVVPVMDMSSTRPYERYTEEEPSNTAIDETPSHTAIDEIPSHTAIDETPSHTAIDETSAHTAIAIDETPSHTANDDIWNGTDFDFPDDWLAGCSLEGCGCTECSQGFPCFFYNESSPV